MLPHFLLKLFACIFFKNTVRCVSIRDRQDLLFLPIFTIWLYLLFDFRWSWVMNSFTSVAFNHGEYLKLIICSAPRAVLIFKSHKSLLTDLCCSLTWELQILVLYHPAPRAERDPAEPKRLIVTPPLTRWPQWLVGSHLALWERSVLFKDGQLDCNFIIAWGHWGQKCLLKIKSQDGVFQTATIRRADRLKCDRHRGGMEQDSGTLILRCPWHVQWGVPVVSRIKESEFRSHQDSSTQRDGA